MRSGPPLLLVALALCTAIGCAGTVDRFAVNRIVHQQGAKVDDLGKACALGSSLSHALAALGTERRPPRMALIIAETTAGLCGELDSMEAELASVRARRNWQALGEHRVAEMRDARLREQRLHTQAAKRYYRAWGHMTEAFGPFDGDCAKIRERDEITYLLGLVAGLRALLHDKAGGSTVGVPADVLGEVSRGARCLDNEEWWHAPAALEAAAWAVIPGSAPEGVDPWEVLRTEAEAGDDSGIRVAWSLYVLVAGNAGLRHEVEAGIVGHAASLASTPADPDWLLLDEYALRVTGHESDLIWTDERGHRTETFGELPRPAPSLPSGGAIDPFGADPFGGDTGSFEEDPEPTTPDPEDVDP
jgi:hypothetical protein